MTTPTDSLDWIVTNYLASKIQAKNIMNYNGANLAFNHGRDMAKKLGLDPAQITPFPCPTNVSVTNPEKPALPTWQKLALGAAMLGAGAGIAPLAGVVADAMSPGEVMTEQDDGPDANVGFQIR